MVLLYRSGKGGKVRANALRKRQRLTQGEMAERIGVTLQTISHWEIGKVIPPKKWHEKIEKEYGCPFDEIEWSNKW